ncbi:MAG: tetratricopeptide repeat protein [Syntrophorhabdaceae bacterium]
MFGCTTIQQPPRFAAELQNALDLYARGDFDAGLKANQAILAQSERKPPGDQALFNIGLIYASDNYPKKDYKKSLGIFHRVIREYPFSQLAPQAKTWIGVLAVIERSKEADVEVEQTKKKLAR